MISRRSWLVNSSAFAMTCCVMSGQSGMEFKLDLGEVEFEPELPVKVSAATSSDTICQVRFNGSGASHVFKTEQWKMEAYRPQSTKLDAPGRAGVYLATTTIASVQRKKPTVSIGMTQDLLVEAKRLAETTNRAQWRIDPTKLPSPGGSFFVDLGEVSTVHVRIWLGESTGGELVHEARIDNVPNGGSPIPWNLQTDRGTSAKPGSYLAKLFCTPHDRVPGRRPTLLYSTFRVE